MDFQHPRACGVLAGDVLQEEGLLIAKGKEKTKRLGCKVHHSKDLCYCENQQGQEAKWKH